MTTETSKSFGPFLVNNSAILKARVTALNPEARAKLKKLESEAEEAEVRATVKFEKQRKLVEQRDAIEAEIGYLEKFKERAAGGAMSFGVDDEAKLKGRKAEFAEKQAELKALTEAKERHKLPRSEARALAELAVLAPPVLDWLQDQPSGTRFVAAPASVSLKKGETFRDAIAKRRAGLLDFANEISVARRAQVTLEEAKRAMRADVARLAAKGAPDVSPALRYKKINLRGDHKVGLVQWPVERFAEGAYTEKRETQLGNAFVAWLFRDQLLARLDSELERQADSESALSVDERAIRIKECSEIIMRLWREEERLLCLAEEAGEVIPRVGRAHPLAFLEIEIAPPDKD